MTNARILCLSSSMGLGHVTRDLAVIQAVRKRFPSIEVVWLTAPPNTIALEEAGEVLHPASSQMQSQSEVAERLAQPEFRYDSRRNSRYIQIVQKHNAKVLAKVLSASDPNLIFGDESLEIFWVLTKNPKAKRWPLVTLTDSLIPAMTQTAGSLNPLRRFKAYIYQRKYVQYMLGLKNSGFEPYAMLYVGTEEDVQDKSMGIGLPRLRSFFNEHFQAIGYIVPFDGEALRKEGKTQLKHRLGYSSDRKLVLASIGGTGIGRELLERVDQAASELVGVTESGLEIALVCGPRLSPESLHVTSKIVTVRGYVPRLYEHFAAADFVVVEGGLTSAVELAGVGTPFVYVPIQGHVEQEFEVAPRLERLGLGKRMSFMDLTPQKLAEAFEESLRFPFTTSMVNIPVNGADAAAGTILKLLRIDSSTEMTLT